MSPLRLLVLGILGYILYRLITGGRKTWKKPSAGNRSDGMPSRDVLVEDPVCKTYVPKGQAFRLKQKGREYFFCSKQCRDTFLSDKGGTE